MKFKVKYNFPFLRKNWAMTLWPYILVNAPKERMNQRWFRHELQHCYQVKRKGILRFYLGYLYHWIRVGFSHEKHPYEIEAREYEHNPMSPEEWKWFHDDRIQL